MAETTGKLTGVKLLTAIKSEIEASLKDQDVSRIVLVTVSSRTICDQQLIVSIAIDVVGFGVDQVGSCSPWF